MVDNRAPKRNRSTGDRAAEDAAHRQTREAWEDEGGSVDNRVPRQSRKHARVVSGRIVQTRKPGRPYKVVLTHEDGSKSEHPCGTMREGEAFIRSVAPPQPKRDTSRDHAPGKA